MYDTIEEFNVDSKAEYSALSSTRSQKKETKTNACAPLIQYRLRCSEFRSDAAVQLRHFIGSCMRLPTYSSASVDVTDIFIERSNGSSNKDPRHSVEFNV